MNKQIMLIGLFITAMSFSLTAQKLLKPFELISHKKPTYILTENGKEIEGTVKKLKRKKGLIKEINIKDAKGNVTTIPLADIKHAYLPQSGLDKFLKFSDFIDDATQWNDGLYDKERIKEGYAFFEKSEVMVKKNKMTLLVQLLNPGVCDRIKVFHDPFAAETASVGVAGIKLAGGDDKSYYVSKDEEIAYKLPKKKFKDSFDNLFGDCNTENELEYTRWSDFEEVLFKYNAECKK